jgi:hypothetical protein
MRDTIKTRRRALVIAAFLLALLLALIPACGGDGGDRVMAPFTTVLPVGVPVDDAVAFFGFNFYSARVTPGELYKVSITVLDDDADLLVFGRDATFTFLARCSIDNTGFFETFPEDCVIRAMGNVLYFGVDGSFLSSSFGFYTITIELVTSTDLSLSIPVTDAVARTGAEIYTVAAAPAGTYTVSLTGLTDDADLYVFGTDGTFTPPALCVSDNIGTLPENCTFSTDAGDLFFIVDGLFSVDPVVVYDVLVTPVP